MSYPFILQTLPAFFLVSFLVYWFFYQRPDTDNKQEQEEEEKAFPSPKQFTIIVLVIIIPYWIFMFFGIDITFLLRT